MKSNHKIKTFDDPYIQEKQVDKSLWFISCSIPKTIITVFYSDHGEFSL
jgi:hypothetical protein